MDAVSPWAALAVLLAATLAAWVLLKCVGAPPAQGRHAAIDGLRGYLALVVMTHHASIWYFYLRSGVWQLPPSRLYANFGGVGVALFFMITSFLFCSKLLEARGRGLDWGRLFVSRVLRLVPLYLLAMALLLAIVVQQSGATLHEPWPQVLRQVLCWLGFTFWGNPDINGVAHTMVIVAGVIWSLPYEWFFYLMLPLLALPLGIKPARRYLVLSLLGLLLLRVWHPKLNQLLPFVSGYCAARVVHRPGLRAWARSQPAAWLVLGCLAGALLGASSSYGALSLVLLTVVFVLVAAGCDLFGLLVHPVSRTLGELAYGLYLLHGLLLFGLFKLLLGTDAAARLTPAEHWAWVACATPVLVGLCWCAFRWVERPAMAQVDSVTAWLRRSGPSRPAPAVLPG